MNCPKCGALLTENAKFCVSCGARLDLEESDPTDDEEDAPSYSSSEGGTHSFFRSIPQYKIIILIVGAVLVIIGIVKIFSSRSTIVYTGFGGDYQTYVYRGVYEISNLLASIGRSIGWLMVALGVILDVNVLFRDK